MNTRTLNSAKRQAGLSLVDVMVGMVIALVATIIIFQVFGVSEQIKRSTTGGSDASQNAAQAMMALEHAVKMAGYGFNASDVNAVPPFVPLVVNFAAAANQPDSISVTYRPPTDDECFTSDRLQAQLNNVPCSWEYGTFSPQSGDKALGLPPMMPMTVNYCVIQDANLHAQLVSRKRACSWPPGDGDDTVLVDNIAQFKAIPVMDAGNIRMLALQIVVVARNTQPEKPRQGQAACDTTTGTLPWLGGQVDVSGKIGLAAADDWKCYHYRTFSETVPLRNVIWH